MGTTAVPGTTGDSSATQSVPVFTPSGGTPVSPWTDVDLSAATMNDTQSLYTASGSTLGVESTIVLNGVNHGRQDTMDALFFTVQLSDFDREKHFGVAVRATWGSDLPGNWEMYVGVGNDSTPAADGGVYLATQLKALGASVGGNDYGLNPSFNQSVNYARYLAGMINYRSDRQDGSCGQSANADRTLRAGQNRSVDPGTAMTGNDQFIMVGFGNQSARADGTYNGTLTGLKIQFQLLAHYGQDS